jgi:hypothetical protein
MHVKDLVQERRPMTTTLTPEQRLGLADQEAQALKDCFVEAIGQLQRDEHVDGIFQERMENIEGRLRDLRRELREDDLDKAQISEFHGALWEIKDLLDESGDHLDLDTIDKLLVCIERVRHVIRDALDEHVAGVPDDAALAFAELREWLPSASVAALSELVGVDRRTPSRWAKSPQAASRRLQLVASLVAVLRHNWTEEGIVAWFQRPRRGLSGRRPIAVLDDPLADQLLLSEARSSRSQDAS